VIVGAAEAPARRFADPVVPIDTTLLVGRNVSEATSPRLSLDDLLVSGRHALFERRSHGVEVRDLGSKNRTLVNGRAIGEPTRLADGDIVFIGAHALVFRLITDAQSAAIRDEQERPFGPVATVSPSLALACDRLKRLAPSDAEVLLTGETGVGKEVFAGAIHRLSGRTGPLLAVNCAALPRDLVESELFGYARGAHSQATRSKPGLVEQAHQGTLFLDEIGEMPSEAQAKLLRFLQTKAYTPLGAVEPVRMNVRLIAATHHRPTANEGSGLRLDLAARLGAHPISLPPLRHRIEDMMRLAGLFLGPTRVRPFEVAAFRRLCLYRWPGNVRQLEKVITEAAILSERAPIGLEHLPEPLAEEGSVSAAAEPARSRARRPAPPADVLERLLAKHRGNVADVARELDRQWAVVWRWIVKSGIDVDRFRDDASPPKS